MSGNCFLKQEATSEIISNVAGFCAECYSVIHPHEIIFYDLHNYHYLCASCQEEIQDERDENGEPLTVDNHSLFN